MGPVLQLILEFAPLEKSPRVADISLSDITTVPVLVPQ